MMFDVKTAKITVAVPPENLDDVRNAMCEAGAGVIGDYAFCTMATDITGSFKAADTANPYIGEIGKLEFVKEVKLESICRIEKVKNVLAAIRNSHPYEEPGIDIYPLIDEEDL